jgi:nucleotide-binding universal stress UspA family protein
MAESANQELRILLPSKPEDDLREVARLLQETLPRERAHVRRLYIYRPVESDFFIPETYTRFAEIARLEFEAESATRVETAQEMRALASEGFEVSAEVIRGTPTEEILREADIWLADLVAVRTRSVAARDNRIGGMASALLYHATCPVLTYHAIPEDYRLRRILIPTDFSASSCKSTDWGLALAETTGAEPVLLHVIPRSGNRLGIDHGELSAMAAEELERWRARVDPILRRPVKEARVIEASTPAEGILSFARDEGADLIVMSATGSSVVLAVLLGANTRKVVRGSACPVLVIPASNRVTVQSFLRKGKAERREKAAQALPAGVSR